MSPGGTRLIGMNYTLAHVYYCRLDLYLAGPEQPLTTGDEELDHLQ